MTNKQSIVNRFKALGAESAQILGDFISASWVDVLHANRCLKLMEDAGVRDIRMDWNGDHTALVVSGLLVMRDARQIEKSYGNDPMGSWHGRNR